MALGFAMVKALPRLVPNIKRIIYDVTCDNAYVTGGGWTLTAANFGMTNQLIYLEPNPIVSGYFFTWDQVNNKLKAYKCGASGAVATECANNEAGLNTLVVRCQASGW